MDADLHAAAPRGFVTQFFPLFLLGAVFGKLMDDSWRGALYRPPHG